VFVMAGPESERERSKRHSQRVLFDDIAQRYEASRPGYPDQVVEFVVTTAGLGPGSAVLEIGCGTGQLTESLARYGFQLTAIDIGASMVAAAHERLTNSAISFEVTSFEDLAGADASFDLIVSSAAFHWIDPEIGFSKSARLLRPGGWFALLGNAEEYDAPLGPAIDALWIKHGDTGGAWERRPSDPEVIDATGLFGTLECLGDTQQVTLPTDRVVALEQTRATFLSWTGETQRRFTEDLGALVAAQPAVHLTRRTFVTMAQVP
jgi:ubiquinone/menaquinone biosynthesis C-methylase UbiE